MLQTRFKLPLIIILLTTLCFATIGCSKDNNELKKEVKEYDVTLTFKAPYSISSRAIGEMDDCHISDIILLLFSPLESTFIGSIEMLDFQERMGEIMGTVKIAEGHYDIVILANSQEFYRQNPLKQGDSKNLLKKICAHMGEQGWVSDPHAPNYNSIPMSGVVEDIRIDQNSYIRTELVRTLVKANIHIEAYYTQFGIYELKKAYLCNYNSEGYLYPGIENLQYKNPVPNKDSKTDKDRRLIFESSDGNSIVDEIFFFEEVQTEFKPDDVFDPNENICLIIEGYFPDIDKKACYRLNFIQNDKYLELVRNHCYSFVIHEFPNLGYESWEDALGSNENELSAQVLQWSDIQIENPI